MKRTERSAAKKKGEAKYFTGRPCKHGHIAERQTQSGACTTCDAIHYQRWTENNPGGRRAAHLKWVEANPGAINKRVKKWRAENPESARVHNSTRRARANSGPGFTAADIEFLIKAQRGRCAHCRKSLGSNYHVDHIKSLSKGGSNSKQNIQIACPLCNLKKQAKDPIDFAQECGRLV